MRYNDLGRRIREERLKMNLTQEQLAEYVEISSSYMGQIERAERNVTLDTLIKIANKLGVTIDYLLKESISVDDESYINQFRQLISGRNLKEKQMAMDVIKIMFSHIDEIK